MKKLLSIVKHPYITSRLSTAFQLSAIQSLNQYSDAWLCSEFINLRYCPEDKNPCDFLHNDFWFSNQKMFARESLLFSNVTLKFDSFDVIQYIIFAINSGKYVTGDYNCFYIPQNKAYHNYHKRETYMIYGYNLLGNIFYVMGETISGYASFEVKFDDYLNSISNRDDNMFNINTMNYNLDYEFSFNKEKLYNNLLNYVQSTESAAFYDVNSVVYGIEAIKALRASIANHPDDKDPFCKRSLSALCEHKLIMRRRVKYMSEHTDIRVVQLLDDVENNYNLSVLIKQLYDQKDVKEGTGADLKITAFLDKLIETDMCICKTILSNLH